MKHFFYSYFYSVILTLGLFTASNMVYSQINLDSGLVGYFKLDSNYADSSATALHGTANLVSNTSGIHGLSNTAGFFNGSSSKINVQNSNRGISNTISVSLWVKTTTNSVNNEALVSKYDWQNDKGFILEYKYGYPDIHGRNGSGSYIQTLNNTGYIADGDWHHVLAVIAENTWEIWVDGVLANTTTSTATVPSLINSQPTSIGSNFSTGVPPWYFGGALDDVRIYSRELRPTEIAYLSNQENNATTQNITGCNSFTSPWNGNVWTTSGVYTNIKYGGDVGDSIDIINLQINNVDNSVVSSGNSLRGVSNSSYSYQWLDCDNGNSLIPGAQDSVFIPTQNGNYALAIANNSCLDTSICMNVNWLNNLPPYGNSIFLDGVSNYLEIPNHSSLHSTTNLTLEAWIKPCSVSGTNVIYSKIWCSGNQNSYFFSVEDGKLKWVWYSGGCGASNGTNRYKSTSAIIQTNVWQHVAVVHSPTGVKLFLNGAEVNATLEAGSYGNLRASSQPIRTGTYRSLSGNYGLYFSGQMDELRVWNQSISNSLITARFDAPLNGNEPGLMGYYNLDNYTVGANQTIPNNGTALGSVGDAITKGSSSYITPFYLDTNKSFILGDDSVFCASTNFTYNSSIPGGSYTWQDGSTNPMYSIGSSEQINISFSNSCLSSSDSVEVIVQAGPLVSLGNDTAICNVTNYLLDVTTLGGTYLWSDNSTYSTLSINQNGVYSVTVTNNCGSVSDTISITGFVAQTSISVNTCGVYTSPSGNYFWDSTGVYFDTLVSFLGCDSIVEVNLTVTPLPLTALNVSNCYSYTSPSGNLTWYASGVYYDTLTAIGGCDSVLEINLVILPYEIITITASACDSYTSPSGNISWNSSGTYLDLVANANSCDTLYNITLTISNSSASSINEIACNSFTSPSGNYVWTSSGVYIDTLVNSNGCDSIITCQLTILNATQSVQNVDVCNSYTWSVTNDTYNSSGQYRDTVVNAAGCDSILILNLMINSSDTVDFTAVSCGVYFWPITGVTYSNSGVFDTLLINQNGCDSLIRLNLTINSVTNATLSLSSCDSLVSPSGNYTWNQTGTYYDTLVNSNGCDSLLTIQLTINSGYLSNATAISCDSYLWVVNGQSYTISGIYSDTMQSVTGCDSVLTLDLTINNSSVTNHLEVSCGSYTWPINGVTYSNSAVDTAHFINVAGCDSLVVLDVTINGGDTTQQFVSNCGPFIWAANNQTFDTTGVYQEILMNSAGCDSLVILDLIILYPSISDVYVTTCDSFNWSQTGASYVQTGLFTDTVTNGFGCDSIINLHLTINNSTSSVITEKACGHYTAPDGTVYSSTGQYQAVISNALGCDSAITINLQVTETDTSIIQISAELHAVSNPNYSYQWLDCNNGSIPIPGANDSIFIPNVNGSYAVEITNGSCLETSNCFSITNVGINELILNGITLYPNPVSDVLNVRNTYTESVNLEIVDLTGKLILRETIKMGVTQIELANFSPGVYLVKMKSNGLYRIEKVVVH